MPVAIKIKIQNEQKAVLSGEELCGMVILKDPLRSSFSINGLKIRLCGVINTFQIQGPYSKLREQHTIVDEEIILSPANTPLKISKGNNKFPFKITVPETAQPTLYVNRDNNIRYILRGEVDASSKLSKTVSEKEIIVTKYIMASEHSTEKVEVIGGIPASQDDVILTYGDGNYPEREEIIYENVKSESDGAKDYTPYVINMQDQKVQTYNPGSALLLSAFPKRNWGHDAIYSNRIYMDVIFPHPGLWADEPLNISVKCYVDGDLPRLCLQSLKVVLTETTFICAKGVWNNERKHYTVFKLDGPIDLTTSPSHDFTQQIFDNAKFPTGLAPDFKEETMARNYSMSVHLQFFKGDPEDKHSLNRQVLSARHEVQIFGVRDSSVLPSYSYLN